MPAGRPPIYQTTEEIQPHIDRWIESVKNGEHPTITGLCIELGFDSKSTLWKYAEKPEFSYSIKRCLLIVENGYETALRQNNATGSIFALKNMGWKDKMEQDVRVEGGVQLVFTDATKDADSWNKENQGVRFES